MLTCRKKIIPQELYPWYESLPTANNVLDDQIPEQTADDGKEKEEEIAEFK